MRDTQTRCARCEGFGSIADDDDGAPWSAWLRLPYQSAAAVRLGLVKPVTCPDCGGSGERPVGLHWRTETPAEQTPTGGPVTQPGREESMP